MIQFGPLKAEDLDEQDMLCLKRSIDTDPKSTPEEVRNAILSGFATVWRFQNGSARGVLLVRETPDKELFIWHLGGKGLIKNAEFILETLLEFARLRGLRGVGGYVKAKGLLRLYERMGFKPQIHFMFKEI